MWLFRKSGCSFSSRVLICLRLNLDDYIILKEPYIVPQNNLIFALCSLMLLGKIHQNSTNLTVHFSLPFSSSIAKQWFAKQNVLSQWNKTGNSRVSLKTPRLPQTLQNIIHPYLLYLGKAKWRQMSLLRKPKCSNLNHKNSKFRNCPLKLEELLAL